MAVEPEKSAEFTLKLRIPAWCKQARLSVNGKAVRVLDDKGYACLKRVWKPGDRVELNLAMPVARVYANPKVRQNCGRVALQRGPIVYCLEGEDHGESLNALALPQEAEFKTGFEDDLLGGVVTLSAPALKLAETGWGGELYRTKPAATGKAKIKAVPYCTWDNRAPGEMIVWLREV